jgi:alkylation response protein AidB-like acyl-CoA dehydrogenase
VNFTFSDEQDELRKTVRRFLEEKSPSAEVRRLMDTPEGHDPATWKQLAQELALTGLAIPEEHGGQGFGFVELGIVLEEMGRALFPSPFLASAGLAAAAVQNAGTPEQQADLLPGIAAGETIATLALAEANGRWDADGIEATATPAGDGFTLEGTKTYVLDGHQADLVIVAARAPGTSGTEGVGLFVVDPDGEGVSRKLLDTIDRTRKQARIDLAGAKGTALGSEPSNAWPALETTLDQVSVLLAAEATGAAERAMEMAVQYAKDRVQFGRPIGSFQAVKHRCADMLLQVESAKTAAYYGLWAAAEDPWELRLAAPMAKAYCTEAAYDVARSNIQVHGGIGFTWEHDAHLYFRRGKTSELLFGDPAYHRSLLADRLGI